MRLEPCDIEGECTRTYEVCYDYGTTPPDIIKTLIGSSEPSSIPCFDGTLELDLDNLNVDPNGIILDEIETICTYTCN